MRAPKSRPGGLGRSSVLSRVKRIYETNPYPAVDASIVRKPVWRLPPMEWSLALARPGREQEAPERILIAGCGTGNEAFGMRRRYPNAEIVGVDFSPRTIAVARQLQRRYSRARTIRFVIGDLTAGDLKNVVGDGFDFVSCHGVMSYIPRPERVLRNLSSCMRDDGALYLGVNGAEHFSIRVRPFLQSLGIDVREIADGKKLRDTLQFADEILGMTGKTRLAKFSTAFLGSDLFGSFNQTLPLERWIELAAKAKLHFQGSYIQWRMMRRAVDEKSAGQMLPRSRAEMQELVEQLAPVSFHPMVLTKRPAPAVPWLDHEELMRWRPRLTGLYSGRLPGRSSEWKGIREFVLKSVPVNTRLEWRMAEWEMEILRQSGGSRSLGEILRRIPARVDRGELRRQLYVLFQLMVINLLPPAAPGSKSPEP